MHPASGQLAVLALTALHVRRLAVRVPYARPPLSVPHQVVAT